MENLRGSGANKNSKSSPASHPRSSDKTDDATRETKQSETKMKQHAATATITKPAKAVSMSTDAPTATSGDHKHDAEGGTRDKKKHGKKKSNATKLAVTNEKTPEKRKPDSKEPVQKAGKEKDKKGKGKLPGGKQGVVRSTTSSVSSMNQTSTTNFDLETLGRKVYEEDDPYDKLVALKIKAVEDQQRAHRVIDWILRFTFVLTILAAFLTAASSYIFFHLPIAIYSSHILKEIFYVIDPLISANGFSKLDGIQTVTPLPIVNVVTFAVALHFLYIAQYPKETILIRTSRCSAFFFLQGYLIICIMGYSYGASEIEQRMDTFYKMDKDGLTKHTKDGHGWPLHYLDNSQFYFGCCGYRDNGIWGDVHPQNFSKGNKTWPLSCCDPELSEVACWLPVEETVTYPTEGEDDEGEKITIMVTKNRLHEETCFADEYQLSLATCCAVIIPLGIFIIISFINFVLSVVLSTIITKYDIDLSKGHHILETQLEADAEVRANNGTYFLGITRLGYQRPVMEAINPTCRDPIVGKPMLKDYLPKPGDTNYEKQAERYRFIDIYSGLVNGINYGKLARLNGHKRRHTRPAFGSHEKFCVPICSSMDYGWWIRDEKCLEKTNWFLPKERYPQKRSEMTKFVDEMGRTMPNFIMF